MSLGVLLRGWRERALLTQEELARRADVSVRTIRRLESDDRVRPRGGSLRQIATALALSGDEQSRLTAAARGTTEPDPVPRQLPADIAGYAGRTAQLTELDAVLNKAGGPTTVTVTGTAGVGKTTLAIHWAHLVADRFPDGQLYVNLRGFDPGGPPVEPSVVIRGFLETLGASPHRVPSDLDAQTALYRSTLAGRHILIVLDNARDAAQVRPLLPGTPGCLALVTSRDKLTGLIATEAARPLPLELLSAADARDLLSRRLGAERVAAEPAAVDRIIASCAHLPLALAVAAAHATTRSLARLAEELDSSRLDAFDVGDGLSDVRQVFACSYGRLGTAAATMFRLLGLHPGPDISLAAAASLAGRTIADARQQLAELARAHLLTEHTAGRFTAHDLLRTYAAELARHHDTDADRRAALHRMFDHYLHSAYAAGTSLDPQRTPGALNAPGVATAPENPGDPMAWFSTEHPVLLGCVMLAASEGFDTHAVHIAWLLPPFLDRRGYWQDWATTQAAGLEAAERAGDVFWQARSHGSLGGACTQLGRWDDADRHLHRALDLFGELDDGRAHAHIHLDIDWLYDRQGDHRSALRHAEEALRFFQSTGDRSGESRALNNVGWHEIQLGACESGLDFCRRALAIDRELGHVWNEATTLDSLGLGHHRLGQYGEAIECYRGSVRLSRESIDRLSEAEALGHLGDSYEAIGDRPSAEKAWRDALEILDELDHPDADDIRIKLDYQDSQGIARFEPGRS